jgi:diaminopimelate epimerase
LAEGSEQKTPGGVEVNYCGNAVRKVVKFMRELLKESGFTLLGDNNSNTSNLSVLRLVKRWMLTCSVVLLQYKTSQQSL